MQNLATSLLQGAQSRGFGPRAALREPKRVWSYDKLADETGRAGHALLTVGIEAGETVALLMHDSMELAAALLGAIHIGAVAVPVSILVRPTELRDLLNDCGASAIVVAADLVASVELVRSEVPTLREVLAVGGARLGQRDWHALMHAAEHPAPPCEVADDAPAFVLYSAGTHRTLRGVAHGRAAVEAAAVSYAHDVLAMSADDRVFSAAKLTSAYGLGLGLFFPLARGASSYLLPSRPRPRTLFDVMAAYRPTVFAATPSLYAQMVNDFRALTGERPRPFQSVRHAVSGAETLPAPLGRRIHETFGVAPLHGFGVTEALHFVFSNRAGNTRPASVGRPLHGIEARVVGPDGAPLQPDQMGRLELRGPTVARSYFRQTDTHAACANEWVGGWLRLRDRFVVDREGYFFHCGREDELFKVGGRWVTPTEIEQTLLTHPAVRECAVVEGEDDDGLPQPHAFIALHHGHAASPELRLALMEYVKAEIAPYKYPRAIDFVDSLPKCGAGKVERWRLRPRRSPTLESPSVEI